MILIGLLSIVDVWSSCFHWLVGVTIVEQQRLTFLEHLSSHPVFSGVRVTWSLVLYVCSVDRCLSFCAFSFGHCVVCSSSIYCFWLPLVVSSNSSYSVDTDVGGILIPEDIFHPIADDSALTWFVIHFYAWNEQIFDNVIN